jgi:hypothetical protein
LIKERFHVTDLETSLKKIGRLQLTNDKELGVANSDGYGA